LPKPNIYLGKEEMFQATKLLKEVKEKTKKDKVLVFQPFGRGVVNQEGLIMDPSGRSFEPESVINLVKALSKKMAVVFMGEIAIQFNEYGVTEPIAVPLNTSIREWAAIINCADYFLGCDSVGQHIAYSMQTPSTVVIGSTFKENISYPDCKYFDILDMGEGARVYSPIRITADELADRTNEGVMMMNEKIEEVIVKSVVNNQKKWNGKPQVAA
jgi:ADP-heptose:LPS heptosyltransferase